MLDLPFSEGVGNIVRDRSLYGNRGTIYGASWIDGKIGKGLNFNGVDNYVEVTDATSLDVAAITIVGWIKTSVKQGYLLCKDNWTISAERGYALYEGLDGTGVLVFFVSTVESGDKNCVGTIDVADGEWHFIVGTFDGENMKVYVDGELDGAPLAHFGSIKANSQLLTVGKYTLDGGEFDGIIDEVRVYNRALTLAETQRLYNEGR